MLELDQFKQLKDLNELKSHLTTKFVVIPDDLQAKISYKALLRESTLSELKDKVTVIHIFRDQSCCFFKQDELDLIDPDMIYNVVMIDRDKGDGEEYLIVFENAKAFKDFVFKSERPAAKDSVYLKLDDEMIAHLEAETLKAQIELCDQKIAKAEREIELANKALKEFRVLKQEVAKLL